MNKKLLALLMGATLTLAACGSDEAEETPANNSGSSSETATADAGNEAKLYENKCSQCHGQNLEGGIGPALDAVGSSLSQEEIEEIIISGKGAMPGNTLKGEDVTAVAAWLAEKK